MALSGTPKWKGTFFFNLDTGGFTESLYSGDGGPSTYGQVLDAMLAILPLRLNLSQTVDMAATGVCINPVVPIGIRVTDLTNVRRTYTNTDFSVRATSFFTTNKTAAQIQADKINQVNAPQLDDFQNDSPNVAAKIQFTDGVGHNANHFLHGFPVWAMDNDWTALPVSGFTRRLAQVSQQWVTNLKRYSDKIIQQNMGLRFTTNIWAPQGPPFVAPITGDSRPSNVVGAQPTYDSAHDYYTFFMPQPLPQDKMRVVLRGFKNLNFLNGRWLAKNAGSVVVGTTTYYGVTVVIPYRNQLPWDGNGTICPETFTLFQPLPSVALAPAFGIPGVQFNFITSKKIGRPFEVERGRISRRRR